MCLYVDYYMSQNNSYFEELIQLNPILNFVLYINVGYKLSHFLFILTFTNKSMTFKNQHLQFSCRNIRIKLPFNPLFIIYFDFITLLVELHNFKTSQYRIVPRKSITLWLYLCKKTLRELYIDIFRN